jgi:F-type H+-transporting ATPase subunit b
LEALGINLGYLLIHILSFAILFITLRAWAYQPLLNMMDNRRKMVAQGLEDAQIAAEARANAERQAGQIIADAQTKAADLVREATERADAAGQEVRAAQEAEINKMREQRLAEVEVERTRILSEVRGQVAALAISATQKLIGESLDEKRQHALVDSFFSGVKSGRVTVLEGQTLSGSSAEVTSALPLTAEEQETVKRDVLASIGDAGTVTFRIDPAILGGLVVRVGDRMVDGSVAGQLQNLRQNLQ